jgi:flavorubredoxin
MRQLKPGILSVGAINWDSRLFDELIPLPEGTSYNSYLIKGSQKTALIDTVDPSKTADLLHNLIEAGIDKIDYIIANHGEQDHSGSIPDMLSMYPEAKIVTNEKCKGMLIDLLCLDDSNFEIVADRGQISLGDKTLEFHFTPWVHWPETMCSYLKEDKILFSCDFFGSHLATSDFYATENVYEPAKRYFAEIMMPFRPAIRKNLERIAELDIEIIAPSHGPIHKNPAFIINAYKQWVSDEVKNEVVVAFVSMHGSTSKMVDYFCNALMERGITVKRFNLTGIDIGKVAISLVDAATVVIGSSQVLAGPHPTAAHAAFLVNALRPKTKFASIIGSMGWGGKMVETLAGLLGNLKAEIIEPVISKGYPKEDTFEKLDELADKILAKHKEIGIA